MSGTWGRLVEAELTHDSGLAHDEWKTITMGETGETHCLLGAARITASIDALEAEITRLGTERRELVRKLVRVHGWSQHQVASGLGISQPRVSKIMRGLR